MFICSTINKHKTRTCTNKLYNHTNSLTEFWRYASLFLWTFWILTETCSIGESLFALTSKSLLFRFSWSYFPSIANVCFLIRCNQYSQTFPFVWALGEIIMLVAIIWRILSKKSELALSRVFPMMNQTLSDWLIRCLSRFVDIQEQRIVAY